jgi:hypothetical protein
MDRRVEVLQNNTIPLRLAFLAHNVIEAVRLSTVCDLAMPGEGVSTRLVSSSPKMLIRRIPYSIHTGNKVFCTAYKTTGGWNVFTKREGQA